MTLELDKIDKKIVYHLGKDARLTNKELAKLIKSNQNTIAFRINRLIKNKVIEKFMSVFNITKLNLTSYKLYIKLHKITKEEENRLYSYLKTSIDFNWYAKAYGSWDLFTSSICHNIQEFSIIKKRLLKKFGKHIKKCSLNILGNALAFDRDYLIEKTNLARNKKRFIHSQGKKVKLDKTDLKIIREIGNNARYKIVSLAIKLNINVRTLIKKIKRLKEEGVLQGAITVLNLSKIGYHFSKIIIYLQHHNQEAYEKLLTHCKDIKATVHLLENLGEWDLEIEVETKNIKEVYSIIKNLRNKFQNIEKIEHAIILEQPKWNLLPEKLT